mgnify:CR=1 FL=1
MSQGTNTTLLHLPLGPIMADVAGLELTDAERAPFQVVTGRNPLQPFGGVATRRQINGEREAALERLGENEALRLHALPRSGDPIE